MGLFRSKRTKRRIRALRKTGLSKRQAVRQARRERRKRKGGSFFKRAWKGIKKVAPYAIGAVGVASGLGLVGGAGKAGSLLSRLGKSKVGRLLKRRKRTKIGGKSNFIKRIFKRRKSIRAAVKPVSAIRNRNIRLASIRPNSGYKMYKSSFKNLFGGRRKIRPLIANLKNSGLSASLDRAGHSGRIRKTLNIAPRPISTPAHKSIIPNITAPIFKNPNPYSYKNTSTAVSVAPKNVAVNSRGKTSFFGSLFNELKDNVKTEFNKIVKPASPTGNKAADALQVAEQTFNSVKPYLSSSKVAQIEGAVADTKKAIVQQEVNEGAKKLEFYLNKYWYLFAGALGYFLYNRKK